MHTVSFHARRPRVEMRLQEHESRLTYGERGAIDELRERMFMVFVRRAKRKGRGHCIRRSALRVLTRARKLKIGVEEGLMSRHKHP